MSGAGVTQGRRVGWSRRRGAAPSMGAAVGHSGYRMGALAGKEGLEGPPMASTVPSEYQAMT